MLLWRLAFSASLPSRGSGDPRRRKPSDHLVEAERIVVCPSNQEDAPDLPIRLEDKGKSAGELAPVASRTEGRMAQIVAVSCPA